MLDKLPLRVLGQWSSFCRYRCTSLKFAAFFSRPKLFQMDCRRFNNMNFNQSFKLHANFKRSKWLNFNAASTMSTFYLNAVQIQIALQLFWQNETVYLEEKASPNVDCKLMAIKGSYIDMKRHFVSQLKKLIWIKFETRNWNRKMDMNFSRMPA